MLRLLLLSLVASMGCVDLPSPTSPEPDAEPDPGADPVRDDPVPPPVDSCFVAGTPIATPSGPRPIETLAAGDLVWAFDHETGERVPAPVRRRFVHEAAKVREVRFATGTAVRATDSHPFYAVREARYVKLEALHVGDRVLAHSAQPKATEIVALGPLVPVARVFNVEVATHHNYFAGGVLVHNKTRPIRETPPNHFTSPPLAPDGPRPPVSGGTLAVRGDLIVVAYPLRDEVHLVRYRPADEALQLEATMSFAPGDEPGRVVIATDEAGAAARAFVALRGAGAVAEIDLATGEALARHPVCAAPRGLHWSAGTLRVACAGGQLLSLVDGEVRRRLTLEPDLRDIVVLGDTLYVSLFRRAEILAVREGAIVDRLQVPEALGSRVNARAARVAWRMRALGGDLVLLGQAHSRDPVAVRSTGYGSGATPCEERL
ncbi:MAG: Hint domain-containing protein, partial [Myxococcota bacterium]